MAGASWPVPTGLQDGVKGKPLEVTPPSVGNMSPVGPDFDEDVKYTHWVNTRLRELWPVEP